MSKFSEETFRHWQRPASESEEQRISNAISMIKESINASDQLRSKNIELFIQGSYANNTNVRAESDIDICVMLKNTFYDEYPDNTNREDYGFTESTNNFETFRKDVYAALVSKFKQENVNPKNKCIEIDSNSYRVNADVVPAFQYRNYRYLNSKDPNKFKEGIKFYSLNHEEVINYPKIHIANGKVKNDETQRKYKRLTRILKRTRYKMLEDNFPVSSGITSFLIECLVWNTPNSIINGYSTWSDTIKHTLVHLYNSTKDEEKSKNWKEVSKMLYLFDDSRKWNKKLVNDFLAQVWKYLEF